MRPVGRRAFLAALCSATSAVALGRTPCAGTLRLRLPLYFGGLDPHALDDPLSALFGAAIADPLFALGANGKPYPALASGLPERVDRGTRIGLRPELVSASGKPLSAADVVFSLKRAQALGGSSVLGPFGTPTVDGKQPLSVIFRDATPDALATALASPLTAIVPRGFSPQNPDGTGAFKASLGPDTLTLTRNERAARSPAFLDRIELGRAADLADALRAFEAGQVDVGWLGNGLYRPKAGAIALEGPTFGWFVLRTGLDAKAWGAPGIAQQLASSLPSAALARFGIHPTAGAGAGVRWEGAPSALLVCDDSPYAIELALALSPLLGSPDHEVRATPVPRAAWLAARRSRRFGLMLDFVRAPSGDVNDGAQALLAAVDPALTKRPPKNLGTVLDATRTLTLGVIGEVRISGAHGAEFEGLDAWQLGNVWQNRARD